MRYILSWCLTAMVLLTSTSAWACPYCAGRDKDEFASTLVIIAMVSVPFLIVAVTGWMIRRANTDLTRVSNRRSRPTISEVC
jgi:hypothetical protein